MSTAPAVLPPDQAPLANYDRRPAAPQALAATRASAVERLRLRVPDVKIDFDRVIGSPEWVHSTKSFLTPPAAASSLNSPAAGTLPANEPYRPTKTFLADHIQLFGHGPEVLSTARIKREFTTARNGLKTVVWEQQLDGIPVFEGLLISQTTSRDELVSISSRFLPAPAQAADRGVPDRVGQQVSPTISAAAAVALAAQDLGEQLKAAHVSAVGPQSHWPAEYQHFQAAPLNGDAQARMVWLPMSESSLRLCWEVILTSRARGEMFRVLIDAVSGQAQLRHCLTTYISDASYRVFTSDSPSPFSPGHPVPLTNQPPLVARSLVTLPALNTTASPHGWIDDGVNETRGNNVDAHLDRDNNNLPDTPRPQGLPPRVFDFPLNLNQDPDAYTNASVVQLFYWNNFIHDRLYELGFTEAAGNFQNDNFGRGGAGNDAVQADGMDGGGFNNANFSTPPDGSPGRMQMYVFNFPTPSRDGSLDAEVVLHEYTHGLSGRRVGGGAGISALQPSGMGEGWSDFYAMALLAEPGDDLNAPYAYAAYVTYQLVGMQQNYYFGIRRYPYCTDTNKNPLTFKDIDPAQASNHPGVPRSSIVGSQANEVHNMGEVWCVALHDARASLIHKHGFAIGNELILQLVTDGMNLSPANPHFLQARDAILQADLINTGGDNQNELWAAFARRGMGVSATSPSSATTTGVHEAFDVPFVPMQLLLPANATEGAGVLVGQGAVQVATAPGTNLLLSLSSSDVSEATVPSSVTILAGQTNAVFDVTIIDDALLDGSQNVTITASAAGYSTSLAVIRVDDNETATLTLSTATVVTEGAGSLPATLSISAAPGSDVEVSLVSSDTSEIQGPSTVTIPAGQTQVAFSLVVIDDAEIDGDQPVNLTAHVANWTDGTAAVTVHDNEALDLSVVLPTYMSESDGVRAGGGFVIISGALTTNLQVTLNSDDLTELTIPASVTIPSGLTFAPFDLTLIDDADVDGVQTVHVTASAPGFVTGSAATQVLDDESPPLPSNPQPPDFAIDVGVVTNLTWESGPQSELISNGDFEAGTLVGWVQVPGSFGEFIVNDGLHDPPGPDGALLPYEGNYAVVCEQTASGIQYLYQQFSIPSGVASATLSWAHRVRNHSTEFSTNQQFRVEVRNTNDVVLAVPFTTQPGDVLLGDWVQKSFDLTAFAGQTLRIAFVVNPTDFYLNVHIDDVSVRLGSGGGITNDVYFGTNPAPGPAEFQGSTTNTSWSLPLLAPLTTYYWQIVSHRTGSTAGPVWRFTTRGVDHFVLEPIPSLEHVGEPFNATIVARDSLDRTVSNYTGSVSLRAFRNSGGPASTIEDFESGVWPHAPWQPRGTLGAVSPAYAHDGNYGLTDPEWTFRTDTQFGAPGDRLSWWIRPSTINSRAYFGFAASAEGCFSVVASVNTGQLVLQENPFFLFGNLAVVNQAWQLNKWYRIEIQFASASAVICNLYDSDGTTLLNALSYDTGSDLRGGVAMRAFGGFSLDTIRSAIPGDVIALSPTNSGNFVNGAWSGSVTVLQSGTNVTLQANDGANHLGSSNPFTVIYTNQPPIVFTQPTNQTLYVGETARFSVEAEGSLPLNLQWYFNGLKIVGAAGNPLTLTNVQGSQAGNYSVRISNTPGFAVSSNAVLTVLPTPACVTMPAGAVGWWSGQSNALDNVGTNDGTLSGNTTYANGRVGVGFSFDGNADAVRLGSPSALQLQDFTIETWMRRGSPSKISLQTAVTSAILLGYGQNGYALGMMDSGDTFLTKIGVDNVTLPTGLADAEWHHVAVTKAGTNVTVYADGVAYPAEPYTSTFTFGTTVAIGARGDTLANTFFGTVDEPAVYNRALSASEIQAIYSARQSGKCPLSPVIGSQPQSVIATEGQHVDFAVVATGSRPLSYQWRLNGTNLPGKTASGFSMASVQLTDAGTYSVLIANATGATVSSNATLSVLPAAPCSALPANAVSWWPAENNGLDSVGTNHGTLAGNTTFAIGEAGSSFVFDGSGDAVSLGNPASLQLQNFTIEAWVKRTSGSVASLSSEAQLFSYGQNGFGFGMFHDGRLFLTKIGIDVIATSVGVTDTNWHHVALTKSGSNVVFYIDATAYPAPAYDGVFAFSSAAAIGARGDNLASSFLGRIDELAVYNRALTSPEILALYQASTTGKCSVGPMITSQPQSQSVTAGESAVFSVSANGSPLLAYQWRFNGTNLAAGTNGTLTLLSVDLTNAGNYSVQIANGVASILSSNGVLTVSPSVPCTPLPANAVSWWRAEGNALDSRDGNNGTLVGNTTYALGRSGTAFLFDGITDGVTLGSPTNLHLQNFTIEAWVKRSSLTASSFSSDAELYCFGQGGPGFGMYADGRIFLTRIGIDIVNSTNRVSDTNWHHVALSKSNNVVVFYIDGVPNAAPQYDSVFVFNSNAAIGVREDTLGNSFLGAIDELTIYSRGLSGSEVQSIYAAGASAKCSASLSEIIPQSPPTLQVSQSGHLMFFRWPADRPGYVVETSPTLSPANWTLLPGSPLVIAGQNVIQINTSETNRFYRLKFAP